MNAFNTLFLIFGSIIVITLMIFGIISFNDNDGETYIIESGVTLEIYDGAFLQTETFVRATVWENYQPIKIFITEVNHDFGLYQATKDATRDAMMWQEKFYAGESKKTPS